MNVYRRRRERKEETKRKKRKGGRGGLGREREREKESKGELKRGAIIPHFLRKMNYALSPLLTEEREKSD